jgi:hypothetical protein
LKGGRAWLELGKKASCGMFGPVLEASDGAVDKKASYGMFGAVEFVQSRVDPSAPAAAVVRQAVACSGQCSKHSKHLREARF